VVEGARLESVVLPSPALERTQVKIATPLPQLMASSRRNRSVSSIFFFENTQRNVYAGVCEVHPPAAPTTKPAEQAGSAIATPRICQRYALPRGVPVVTTVATGRALLAFRAGLLARVQIAGVQPTVLAAVERRDVKLQCDRYPTREAHRDKSECPSRPNGERPERSERFERYNAPVCQGPVIAKVIPGLCTLTNSQLPSGL
jgi:hypothetical protein